MPAGRLFILDVGHGNAAVLEDGHRVVVLDAGPRSGLLEFLTEQKISTIDLVLISHADKDHIEGLVALLGSEKFKIRAIRVNTDSLKTSKLWDDLLQELDAAGRKGEVDFEPVLTANQNGHFDSSDTKIEILGPSRYLAGRGPGSQDRNGREITSNSISAVIRIVHRGQPVALFTGDLDVVGLDELCVGHVDAKAPILVFPHHGGRAGQGADLAGVVSRICSLVEPLLVIYSNGRGGHNNPQLEVVKETRRALPQCHIACTQLARQCAANLSVVERDDLSHVYSSGRFRSHCCAGTIIINLQNPTDWSPAAEAHKRFIGRVATTPMCLERH